MSLSEKLMDRYGKEHLSYSSIKRALTDTALFDLHMRGLLDHKSDAMEFGSMYDMLLFDADKAMSTYVVLDHDDVMERCSAATQSTKSPKATKEYKEVKDSIEEELKSKGKMVCSHEDWKTANEMIDRLHSCGVYQQYLVGEYQKEIYTKINGVTVKGYLDCLGNGFISDSKSTRSVDGFRYDVNKLCYDIQAYIYCKAIGINTFFWVVQEKAYPYLPAVVKCTEETLFKGEMKFFQAISKINNFMEAQEDPMKDFNYFEV